MKKLLKLIATVAVLGALTTGCAVNRASATVDPAAKLDTLKTLHVVKHEKDERGVQTLIVDKLRSRGFAVTTGNPPPDKVDAMVTYVDKWFWDITMYLLELTITFREPKSDYPLATGNSLHTSLTRKSPPDMVDEVVSNILKEGNVK